MLEIKNVSKNFVLPKKKIKQAVNDVSFEVNPGRIYGLLGPNGAGKTTTLRIIGTIFSPSMGDVIFKGESVFGDPVAHRKRLGFISGNTGVYDRLNPKEIATYFGSLNEIPRKTIDERFERISEMLDMKDLLGKQCSKFSTGEKQKVSIARMMISDPEILILDEPTLGLDVITSRTIVDFINDSKKNGKYIILSTHIMSEAEYLCDDVGIIHKGDLKFNGTLEALHGKYPGESLEKVFFNLIGE